MKSKMAGIHYPNEMFRALDVFNTIEWGAITITSNLSNRHNTLAALRGRYSNAQILVRAYQDNWYSDGNCPENGRRWAEEIANWWPEDCAPYGCELTIANEQNLSGAGHPLGAPYQGSPVPPVQLYQDIYNFNWYCITRIKELLPGVRIHFPALSQGHNDDQDDGGGYVGFEILRPVVELCDVLDCHTYHNGTQNREDIYYGRRYEKVHALFPNKPIFISEYGSDVDWSNNDGSNIAPWFDGLPDYVEAACPFIWDSDAPNAGWTIWNRSGILDALTNYAPN